MSRNGMDVFASGADGTYGITDPRVAAMWAHYRSGCTLEEIGAVYGVTRERVRQLLDPIRMQYPGVQVGKIPAYKNPGRVIMAARAPGVQSVTGMVGALGQGRTSAAAQRSATTMLRMLGKEDAVLRLWRWRKNFTQRQRIAKAIDALRDLALRLGRTPSIHEANADPATGAHSFYVHHFGTWRKACEAAGLIPNETGSPGHREQPAPRTHCRWGHALTPENVYQYSRQRVCRLCRGQKGIRREQLQEILKGYARDLAVSPDTPAPVDAIIAVFTGRAT